MSILEIVNFLSDSECESFVRRIDENNEYPTQNPFSNSGIFKNNKFIDAGLAMELFNKIDIDTKIKMGFKRPNNIIMTAMYEPGQSFGIHTDTGLYFNKELAEKSSYTLLIYLNDNFEGGTTQFYDNLGNPEREIIPKRGKCLIFDIDLFHEGNPVTSGYKYWIGIEIISDM